jgi:hypothetical protein
VSSDNNTRREREHSRARLMAGALHAFNGDGPETRDDHSKNWPVRAAA